MKKFLAWAALSIGLFVLQTSLLPLIYFKGAGPDILLLVTASYAFFKGSRLGSFMGFLLGLFEDLATGGYFGINIFIKMIIGFACGIFSTRVVRDRFFLPVVGSMVCTAGSFLAFEIIIFCIDYTFYPVEHVQYRLLPMLCYNVIFAWPVHTLVNMVEERFHEKKQ